MKEREAQERSARRFALFMNSFTVLMFAFVIFWCIPFLFRSCAEWADWCAQHGGHIEGEIGVNAKCVGAK